MKLTSIMKTVPAWAITLGVGAAFFAVASITTAQAPPPSAYRPASQPPTGPGPMPTSIGPTQAMPGQPAPTQIQSLLDAPGRIVMVDEYKIGETHLPGPVASIGPDGGPSGMPTRIRFSAAVVYERGREDQRVKGLKVTIERPLPNGEADEVTCFVDRGEMQPLAAALSQMADQATPRRGRDFRGRGRGAEPAGRFTHYSTADFAVSVRYEPGRPVIHVRNPNRPDSRVSLGDESTAGVLQQWNDWIDAAHQVLERK